MYTTKDKIADVCGAILVAIAFFVLYAAASAADLAIAGMWRANDTFLFV